MAGPQPVRKFDGIAESAEAPSLSHELARTDLFCDAGASGDFNATHHEVEAQEARLLRLVATAGSRWASSAGRSPAGRVTGSSAATSCTSPSRPGRARSLRAALAAVLVVLAACGRTSEDDDSASETTASSTTEPAVPLEVDVITETFVDTSRPTAASSQTTAQPDRTILTRIAHPTSGGPYPLIVLSHGATGHPDEYTETISLWASDGFVVASPTFPLTNREVPGALANAGDVTNQPRDVSFVIDEVLAANDNPSSPLHSIVDPEAIGVVGHSLGGATTWAVSFNTATHDERIDSTVIFAGLTLPMTGGEFEFDSGLPLLVLHGDKDDLPLDSDLAAYEQAVSPKWFVTLLGAEHVPAFTDGESPYDELVTRTVLDFWHGTLDGDAQALERVTAHATDPALSSVQHE